MVCANSQQNKRKLSDEVTVMSSFCYTPILQDLFKGFARHLSHLLTEEQNPARKTGELAAGESAKNIGLF